MFRKFLIFSAFAIFSSITVNSVPAAILYSLDDGTGEQNFGDGATVKAIWANQFTVAAGGESITSIDIAFGRIGETADPGNGSPVTAYLWTTATNNLDPRVDATVASSVTGTTQSFGTNTFVNFQLPTPVSLNIGDIFFAGFQGTGFAAAFDITTDEGKSWYFSNANSTDIDPNDLGNQTFADTPTNFGFGGNFLIRANGVSSAGSSSSAVPEPNTAIVLGLLGVFGLAGIRRRRRVVSV
jgi:hypothetical protein